MNFCVCHARGEIIVNVDADSSLGEDAIWKIVQPFGDPCVGIVSASILPRNPWVNLATWMQSYEYLHTIVIGRHVSQRLGLLSIASGAYAAIRRTAWEQTGGWDVGPPEDFDLTLRILRGGWKINFVAGSECYTDLPTRWWGLIKQRLRWDQGAVVRWDMTANANRDANRLELDVRGYGRDGAQIFHQRYGVLWDQLNGVRSPLSV